MRNTVRNRKRFAVRTAAASAIVALVGSAHADYIYIGPDGGQWSTLSNWVYAHNGTPPADHDPMTFYPGDTGTDLTVTTNINNGVANSNVNFNIGAATAHIGR